MLSALAGVSWDKSDYTRADALYQQAAALVENDRTLEGRKTAFEVLIDWAGLAPKLGQGARGVELALRAIDMVDTLPEVDPLNHAVLYNNLAASYDEIEAHRKAIAAYEKSIELHRLHSDAHPDLATALGNLGLTYELVGEMDKAVETVASAVDMQRELLGEDHPQYLLMLYNLGSLQINAGQLESAVENLKAAVAAAGRIYPENHLYTGRFNHRIAQLYVELERPDRARAHASIAIGIYEARDDVPADWLAAMHKIMEASKPRIVRFTRRRRPRWIGKSIFIFESVEEDDFLRRRSLAPDANPAFTVGQDDHGCIRIDLVGISRCVDDLHNLRIGWIGSIRNQHAPECIGSHVNGVTEDCHAVGRRRRSGNDAQVSNWLFGRYCSIPTPLIPAAV